MDSAPIVYDYLKTEKEKIIKFDNSECFDINTNEINFKLKLSLINCYILKLKK